MKVKFISLLLAVVMVMCAFCACGDPMTDVSSDYASTNDTSSHDDLADSNLKVDKYMNNLTGCFDLETEDEAKARPVAVMVNNLTTAQKVQTGLAGASIVYETVVEGGITRLLAVYKNIDKAGQIGTIRSARYSYVDLANGHDALYFHCGADVVYCEPYMKQLGTDNININLGAYNKYGKRISNGLASEHTMYTTGELITKAMTDNKRRTEYKDGSAHANAWQNFADEDKTVKYSDGIATKVSVFFSASYVTNFKYDTETQKYVKSNKNGGSTDYKTGESNSYKNLLVLFTKTSNFADNYHVKVSLNSGEGYYMTNGTLKKIKWSKGDSNASFKITDENGDAVEFSAGNTYVCIPSDSVKDKTTIS